MRLSTRSRYALRVMVELAKRYGMGPVPVAELVKDHNLSVEYVEGILRKLRDAGMVELKRGPKGGAQLLVDPETLPIYDIVTRVENFTPVPCDNLPDSSAPCPRYDFCATRDFWDGLGEAIKAYLKSRNLADLSYSDAATAAGPNHPYPFHI